MSSTLRAPPASVPRRDRDVLADYERTVSRARGGERLLIRDVSWDDYRRINAEREPAAVRGRITYDRGDLEVEMPSLKHERLNCTARRWTSDFLIELDIPHVTAGSTTFERLSVAGAAEPDCSFYIANAAAVADKATIDLDVDPPPDLAIEIDLSPPKLPKAGVYARLGVPEIWRWRDDRLTVNLRQSDGAYAEADRSAALPGFPLDELAAELALVPHGDESAHARDFRRRCRDRAAGAAGE